MRIKLTFSVTPFTKFDQRLNNNIKNVISLSLFHPLLHALSLSLALSRSREIYISKSLGLLRASLSLSLVHSLARANRIVSPKPNHQAICNFVRVHARL